MDAEGRKEKRRGMKPADMADRKPGKKGAKLKSTKKGYLPPAHTNIPSLKEDVR